MTQTLELLEGMEKDSSLEPMAEEATDAISEEALMKELMSHRSRIWALAYTMTRDPHLSEDILQEVAIGLLRRREDYDPNRPFLPWALGFARFKSLEALRARRRTLPQLDEEVWEKLQETFEEDTPEAVDHLDSRKTALAACLAKLSAQNRTILEWKYVEGLSAKEIAPRIERTSTATHSLLQRLRNQLQRCIERQVRLEAVR